MFYKPKFCCQCGEKIERLDRMFWQSRRFCEFCETELQVHDWISRALLIVCVCFGLYGVGSYLIKPAKTLNVAPAQFAAATKENGSQKNALPTLPANIAAPENNAKSPDKQLAAAPVAVKPAPEKIVETSPLAAEKVYFCGAETKKGTPCSRRVKGGGRCWQHVGQTAMLAQEKLLVSQ